MSMPWTVFCALMVIGIVMPAAMVGAQMTSPQVPDITLPSDPSELPRVIIHGLSRGLEFIGIDLESYPSLRSALDGLLGLQMVRLDSLGGLTNLGERVNRAVEGLIGVDLRGVARFVVGFILGLLDKGIALIEKSV